MFKGYENQNEIVSPDSFTMKGGIWLGNIIAAEDILFLKAKNITHVLTAIPTIQAQSLVQLYKNNGIKHHIVDSMDICTQDMSPYFPESCEFIAEALKNGNVFIHCMAGVSRSTTLLTAYLMKEWKMKTDDVIIHIKSKRPYARPNDGFYKQLLKYEKSLNLDSGENMVAPPLMICSE